MLNVKFKIGVKHYRFAAIRTFCQYLIAAIHINTFDNRN